MRVRKQKRLRKALRFYSACYGFRPPFKILCDGTFVHHLLENRIVPADTALANTLGSSVKIFTTRCVVAELRSLGDSYSDSYGAACNLLTARCDHEKRKSAVACITDVVAENNLEHFFVATQDAELRKKLNEVPGVPVIYALRNALFLEKPSSSQHKYAKTAEEERSHMTDFEYKMLKLKKKSVVSSEVTHSPDDGEVNIYRSSGSEDLKSKFKRKKAKGPNPLSCKKRNTQMTSEAARDKSQEASVGDNRISRSRKRKRTRKSKSSSETAAS